jgi:hypothetical protein
MPTMKRPSVFILLLAVLLLPKFCMAFSAIAVVEGHAQDTIYAAWNSPTQKEADTVALEGCRVRARDTGISQLAKKCHISLRQKAAGGGAYVCGDKGCSSVVGYETEQDAVDDAYRRCQKSFGNCPDKGITGWWDDTGYPKQAANRVVPAKKTCSPPAGSAVRSTTHCDNGSCVRTFENGCAVRFEAPYCHDPFTGQWEWKPDGC